jgi:hypothetical protein
VPPKVVAAVAPCIAPDPQSGPGTLPAVRRKPTFRCGFVLPLWAQTEPRREGAVTRWTITPKLRKPPRCACAASATCPPTIETDIHVLPPAPLAGDRIGRAALKWPTAKPGLSATWTSLPRHPIVMTTSRRTAVITGVSIRGNPLSAPAAAWAAAGVSRPTRSGAASPRITAVFWRSRRKPASRL